MFFPAAVQNMFSPRDKMPLVVWYSAAVASASAPPAAATKWSASGHIIATVELCGFGTTGPRPSGGGLSSSSYAPEDMAHEMGRSVPGFHAGEIARVHEYLAGRKEVSSIVLAVVEDHIDNAMLHALLSIAESHPTSVPKKLAIVGGQSSLAAAGKARLYSPDNYYSWIFGLLTAYDKPDAVAAVLSLPQQVCVLVLSPVDELLKPLDAATAKADYEFASSVGGSRITVEVGPVPTDDDAVAAVDRWFAPATRTLHSS